MLHHIATVIVRFLKRRLFFTALNIVGLSIGLASCIVIYLFVRNELSYDRFHSDGDRIYRLLRTSQINDMPYNIGVTSAQFAEAVEMDFKKSIQSTTRALAFEGLVTYDETSFLEEKLLIADSNFFTFFSFPLLRGDATSVLSHGNSIVIAADLARKYFGSEDPIGKVIRLDDQYDMVVTGVMAEFSGNSHLDFEAVASMNIVEDEDWFHDWWGNAFFTYLKTSDLQAREEIEEGLPAFMEKYFGKDFQRVGNRIGLTLEPLQDIYFNGDTRYENNVRHGDKLYVYIFGCTGIILLVLAGINYINLATAQASSRAREVGIRKTLGSRRRTVAMQFLSESLLICVVSALLALGVAQIAIPIFNAQFASNIPDVFNDASLWLYVPVLVIVLAVTAGAYPALLLSSFTPAKVLKGEVKGNTTYLPVRKVLVIFQFAISGFMVISTLSIGEQLRFMRDKDLGYQAEQLVVVNLNNGLINRERHSFSNALVRQHGFQKASLTSGYPGGFFDATTVQVEGMDSNIRMRTMWTDFAFAETIGLSMVAGRYFSEDFASDSTDAVVLNETAVRQLGWSAEQAVGRRVRLSQFDSLYKHVIGVIEDHHFSSLKQKIEPLVISYLNDRGNLLLRVSGTDLPGIVSDLQRTWDSYNTGFPLDFVFVDDVIERLYTTEIVQGRIFTLFSAISLVIAGLGILGLGAYMAAQRGKEIGIRKVLGASTAQVSLLLMKDLLLLVFLSNLIAVPIAWWAMGQWLEAFAYRIELHPVTFSIGAGMVLVIAACIAAFNASRVARQNPVSSLRTE